jgi:hypothetical protein
MLLVPKVRRNVGWHNIHIIPWNSTVFWAEGQHMEQWIHETVLPYSLYTPTNNVWKVWHNLLTKSFHTMFVDHQQSTNTLSCPHIPIISQFKTSFHTVYLWLEFVLPTYFSYIKGTHEETGEDGGLDQWRNVVWEIFWEIWNSKNEPASEILSEWHLPILKWCYK